MVCTAGFEPPIQCEVTEARMQLRQVLRVTVLTLAHAGRARRPADEARKRDWRAQGLGQRFHVER